MLAVEQPTTQPCSECPWRLSNHGRRHTHGFYTCANRDRLWMGLRTAEAPGMTCHPTDARMAEFEGYEDTEGRRARECAGAIILVQRELLIFQHLAKPFPPDGSALRAYCKYRPRGLTREAMAEWAWRVLAGGTPLAREVKQPTEAFLDQPVGHRLPWAGAAVELPRAQQHGEMVVEHG